MVLSTLYKIYTFVYDTFKTCRKGTTVSDIFEPNTFQGIIRVKLEIRVRFFQIFNIPIFLSALDELEYFSPLYWYITQISAFSKNYQIISFKPKFGNGKYWPTPSQVKKYLYRRTLTAEPTDNFRLPTPIIELTTIGFVVDFTYYLVRANPLFLPTVKA